MPYFVMAGALLASLLVGIFGGGAYWIVTVAVWVIVVAYAVVDRRLKARENHGERLAAEPNPRNT